MLELQEGTRLGINYFSEVENDDLRGDFDLTTPGPLSGFSGGVEVQFTLPQGLVGSLRQEITDDLVLYFDLGWADFSAFKYISVDFSGGTSVNANIHFKDITFGGIGGEYRLDDGWTLQARRVVLELAGWWLRPKPGLALRQTDPLRHRSPLRVE